MSRVMLVTGGTGALGRSVVRRLLEGGATVHVPWVAEPEVAELLEVLAGTSSAQLVLHHLDVTAESEVAALFGAIGSRPVEVLVNLVGAFTYGAIETTPLGDWDRMLRLNGTSAFLTCRAAVPAMKTARWGRIINVSSAPAVNHGAARIAAYAASKAALLTFSESLAKEVAPFGITVNTLIPTVIDTPANRRATPDADTSVWLDPK